MTSNDEMEAAQAVASWLRELADRYPSGVPLEKFLGSIDVGVLAGHCDYLLDSGDVGLTADLIDPTCRFEPAYEPDVMGKVSLVECSKCGWTIEPWNAVDFRYCPNCRARVVSGNGD